MFRWAKFRVAHIATKVLGRGSEHLVEENTSRRSVRTSTRNASIRSRTSGTGISSRIVPDAIVAVMQLNKLVEARHGPKTVNNVDSLLSGHSRQQFRIPDCRQLRPRFAKRVRSAAQTCSPRVNSANVMVAIVRADGQALLNLRARLFRNEDIDPDVGRRIRAGHSVASDAPRIVECAF